MTTALICMRIFDEKIYTQYYYILNLIEEKKEQLNVL